MTNNVDKLSQNELNNISLSALPKVIEKKSVEEHLQETIKKNNQDFIKKKASVKLKITPPRKSARIRLTDLLIEEKKKPYEKEK